MNVYVTKVNGLSLLTISQHAQWMISEIACQMGCREMGIFCYDGSNESSEGLMARIDGIIAGLSWGKDVVVCQFPTGNGFKFEWELVSRLKLYRCRVVIFINVPEILVCESDKDKLSEMIELYNQAEVLIVPSLAMRQFLLDSGIHKDTKFVIQEMWDYVVDMNFLSVPRFCKEIHFTGGRGFDGIDNWNYTIPLKVYGVAPNQRQNVYNMGELLLGELLFVLSKGGFGLVWYQDEASRRGIEYGIPFSLAQYLAAGIPVIVPVGISNQILIEKNHLGLVVQSLDEAAIAIKSMTELEYQEYVQCIRKFNQTIRNGYYTKKSLIDAIHALYREDAGVISALEKIYDPGEQSFAFTVLKESYGGNLALSWSYCGNPDGFLVFDVSGKQIYETRNIYQHYFLIKGYGKESGFIMKAYIDTMRGKLCIAETSPIYLHAEQHKTYVVSLIIPAYNAEDYIIRSIDTILAQSFSNLEIIVVDDGSTDRTPDIIDWYAKKYSNVMALHQKNKGPASARNSGIEHASGEYIEFVDSDDMIFPDMVAKLYNSIRINNCDIAVTSAYVIETNGYDIYIQYPIEEGTAITVEVFFQMLFQCGWKVSPVIWNKLYRSSLVKEHVFPEIPFEDEAWTPYILSFANGICYVKDGFYEYDRETRKYTLSSKVLGRTKEEVFLDMKKAVLFYIENGNPDMMEYLKQHTKMLLLTTMRKAYDYVKYEDLWHQIEEDMNAE